VAGWLADEENRALVEDLRSVGARMEGARRTAAPPEGPLAGRTIVVTGSIEGHTRDSIGEYLGGLGAKVTNTVSASTDYLLAGEGGGAKRAKAERLGVAVVDLAELERIVAT
jgi:DNA ligase (NAD+)